MEKDLGVEAVVRDKKNIAFKDTAGYRARGVVGLDDDGEQSGIETNPSHIMVGDSASADAFHRMRISNPVSKFHNKNIHSNHRNQWEEPVTGALIVYSGLANGPFQVAETITGGTSGTIAIVTAVDGGATTLTVTSNHCDFTNTETITGGTSGATATVDSHDTGTHVDHDRDTASMILQVGALNGDTAIRATHRYIPYIPGDSQFIGLTFLFGTATTNRRKRVGYFDIDNGLFLEQTTTGIRFVRRTKTSGSVVDNAIEQADWNVDKMDGTGDSGVNLDLTKLCFIVIDFQWQGGGRIRLGFYINGIIRYAHYINTSGAFAMPWMSTPSLPVRYEIANTGVATGTDTMSEFCSSIISEGGEKLTGQGFSISTDVTPRAVTTEVPVLAIRLKNSFGGGANRKTIKFTNGGVFVTGNAAHFEIVHIHAPSAITATWTDIGGGSAVEYSTDITATTGKPSHKLEEGYVASGQGGKGGSENVITGDTLDQHRMASQNYDSDNSQMFAIYATAITGTAQIYSHISWVEIE